MAQEKIDFERFLEGIDIDDREYIKQLNEHMLNDGCKATYEAKKSGLLGIYKHSKTKKSVINVLLKKQGLLVRIYAENNRAYPEFLETLTDEMVLEIEKTGDCGRLYNNSCSMKCTGYDFVIKGKRYQKCRYGCFTFLVTDDSKPYIRAFAENELKERNTLSS